MAAGLEARSLSGIIQLASNPPKYPRNPTETRREPLILYLARVPGTSDIILSTLKPQLKNVTAEDVASSLYYLHLDSEEDILAEAQANRRPSTSGSATRISLPRKPVPESTKSSGDSKEAPPVKILGETITSSPDLRAKSITRKPVPESTRSSLDIDHRPRTIFTSPERLPNASKEDDSPELEDTALEKGSSDSTKDRLANVPLPTKPLGPRPLVSEPSTVKKPHPSLENQPLDSSTQIKDFALPSEISAVSSKHSSLQSAVSAPPAGDFAQQSEENSQRSFSFTLIRRDPVSGAQWNVGKVLGQPAPAEKKNRSIKVGPLARKPYFDISIHISTPAYNYFRNSHAVFQMPKMTSQGSHGPQIGGDIVSTEPQEPLSLGYHAEMRMEGTDWSSNFKQQARSAFSEFSNAVRDRSHSQSSVGGHEPSPGDTISSEPKNQPKGYTFTSIWGGTCKFSTGIDSRSLRCNHTIPTSVNSGSAMVSDLRFNLPAFVKKESAALVARSKNLQRFSNQIKSKLAPQEAPPPLPPRPFPTSSASMNATEYDEEAPALPPRLGSQYHEAETSDEERPPSPTGIYPSLSGQHTSSGDEEARLDLSLGQEKAGGGNRGKRVKLGKLIIHDEGFKMLDLIVAANMGVWWSVWNSDR